MSKDNDKPKSMLWSKEVLENLTAQEIKLLREIGKQFDITRERIRKIEEKALRKLRNRSDDDPDAT